MNFVIEHASTTQGKAKIALVGPAGCGKTYTALVTAHQLGDKILVIDTENKTSAKYAKNLGPFDVLGLPDYSLKTYIEALNYAAQRGYDVVVVDSLSHAWAGKGGALEQAELAKSKYGGNKFAGWGDVTPLQNQLVDTILAYPTHLIATMRMKIEYALVTDGGSTKPQKIGLGIIQRDSFEYEFDIIGQMDIDHKLIVTKTRCSDLDGFMVSKPDGEFGRVIAGWLSDGELVKSFNTFDDFLYQVSIDFNLTEDAVKMELKSLGFTGWPKVNTRQKSIEMYNAIKDSVVTGKVVYESNRDAETTEQLPL